MAAYFVQFAPTPNDECMRFYVDGVSFLPPEQTATLSFDGDNAHESPLATLLLHSLPMVEEVTVGSNFVTVRKSTDEAYAEKIKEASDATPPPPPSMTSTVGTNDDQATQAAETSVPTSSSSSDNNNTDAVEGQHQPLSSDIHEEILSKGKTDADGITTLDEDTLRALVKMMHWSELQMAVSAILTDHLYSGQPHITLGAPHPHQDTLPAEGDSEVLSAIKELIATTIRPELQKDGGDIRLIEFRETTDKVMSIELLGACKTCKSSKTTLQDLIERSTRHWIPEVAGIEAFIRRKGELQRHLTTAE